MVPERRHLSRGERMKLPEIAKRLNAHLQRLEGDKRVNYQKPGRISPYYCAGASAGRRYVGVSYVSFQGTSYLTKTEARKYLDWLDAGNIGRHYEALKPVSEVNE